MENVEPGDSVKVHLLGESPWAECLEITKDGFRGRIDNRLFHEMSEFEQARFTNRHLGTVEKLLKRHVYKLNDEVDFVEGAGEWHGQWVPAENEDQTNG